MAYDEELADRIREIVQHESGVTEQRMFGGLSFLVNGNMAAAVSGQGGLMLRVDPAVSDHLTEQDHVERFVMRGRELDGWLRIAAAGLDSDDALATWIGYGTRYARSLPPK